MKAFKDIHSLAERTLGVLGLVGILIITANVVTRFILKISMSWSDELLRTLFIYAYFLGAAMIYSSGNIMRLELLDVALEKRQGGAYRVQQVVLSLLNLLFWGLLAYFLVDMVVSYIASGTTTSTSSTPAWVLPLGFMIGLIAMTVCSLKTLFQSFQKQ